MSDYALTDIKAYEIIDNRGMPTIRVAVCIEDKIWGRADVPCGSSIGSYEAVEIRDEDSRFRGKGVCRWLEFCGATCCIFRKVNRSSCRR